MYAYLSESVDATNEDISVKRFERGCNLRIVVEGIERSVAMVVSP